MNTFKKILQFMNKTQFKTFCWTTLNWFISLIVVSLSWLPYEIIPVIVAWINTITKELNKRFNPKYKEIL